MTAPHPIAPPVTPGVEVATAPPRARRRPAPALRLLLPGLPLLAIVLLAILAPLLPLAAPNTMDIMGRFKPPSAAHWLGQDQFGRDILSRLIWGARASLAVAGSAALIACLLGTAIGVLGGFLRGWVDVAAMRGMDVLLSFPPILLAMIVVTLAGAGAVTLVPVLVLVYLPTFARIAQAGTVTVRSQDFVEAARSLGATRARIMARTIVPNIAGPVIVQLSLTLAAGIVLESGLSFLGLGVVPPTPSWGLMVAEARPTITMAPMLVIWPCAALALTILLINALCDGLRDLLDPQARGAALGRFRAPPAPARATDALFEIAGLDVEVSTPQGRAKALDGVGLSIRRGETLALVGESGSGKSLTSLAAMGLLAQGVTPAAGGVWLDGESLLEAPPARLAELRGARISMIFQDPAASLNPVHRVGSQIAEALRPSLPPAARRARVLALLGKVGIPDPEARIDAFPHEMSGGMRQRVMIAMALANRPDLVIADEPTTALDVTVQAQILALLKTLQAETGAALLFISHSLPVVEQIADRIAVMYCGEIVEEGPAAAVLASPRHPYTRALIAAIPEPGRVLHDIPGIVPPLGARPAGCRFAPRCAEARPACTRAPIAPEVEDGRTIRCIRWRESCATS